MANGLSSKHLLLGLLIREVLAPFTGHQNDFEIWTRLGYYMQGFGTPYRDLTYVPGLSFAPPNVLGSISYPPLSAFIFGLTYRAYYLLGEPSRFLYYAMLKQPMVLSDVGIAILLGKLVFLAGDSRAARTASLVWLYLPFTIIVSSVWGALDPFALFLVLGSVYGFLTGRFSTSSVLLGISIFLKTLPVVFLPVLLMQHGMNWKDRVKYSAASLSIPTFGTLLPALAFNWGLAGMLANFSYQASVPGYGAMSVLLPLSGLPGKAPWLQSVAGLAWIPTLALVWMYVYRKRVDLVRGLLFSVLAFSISRPFLPEQWAVYPIGFLLLIQGRNSLDHFLTIVSVASAFLLVNNSLMIPFLSPSIPTALGWAVSINSFPRLSVIASLSVLSTLFFLESILLLSGRNSLFGELRWARLEGWQARPIVLETDTSFGLKK